MELEGAQWGMDPKWLKEQLARPGFSQAELARRLNVAPPVVNKMVHGKRRILAEEGDVIRAYLNAEEPGHQFDTFTRVPRVNSGTPRPKLILWRAVVKSIDGAGVFLLTAEKRGEVERPDFLEYAENAFATQIVTRSNEPVYRLRDILIINPDDAPDDGDDCVFTAAALPPDGSPAIVGQLVKSTHSLWTVRQYAAKADQDLPKKDWPHAWRIVGRRLRP